MSVRAAQDVAHAREHFPEIQGFYEIVVGAHLEPDDAVDLVGVPRDDDHGYVAGGEQRAARAQPFVFTAPHVEHHEIDARALERAREAEARARRGHAEAATLEMLRERR